MWQQMVFVEGGTMNVAADGVCGGRHCACGSRWCLWREALCMWQQMVFVEGGIMNVAADGVCGGRHCA